MRVKLTQVACALFITVGGAVGVPVVPAAVVPVTVVPVTVVPVTVVPVTVAASLAQPDVPAQPNVTPRAVFGWPLAGLPVVARPFEAPPHRFGAGHRGVDLYGSPDQPVLAAGDGTVAFAGMVAGRPVVSVDHAGGLRTTYEPVVPGVTIGQFVHRGDVLGTLLAGHPGCPPPAEPANRPPPAEPANRPPPAEPANRPPPAEPANHPPSTCLHWGVRRGEEYLDPLGLLASGRVRLLPTVPPQGGDP